jgi:hypothetical protein
MQEDKINIDIDQSYEVKYEFFQNFTSWTLDCCITAKYAVFAALGIPAIVATAFQFWLLGYLTCI